MLDSHWLIAELLKTPWLDWINFIPARLDSTSILIFFHVKSNYLRNLLFLIRFCSFFEVIQFFCSKNLGHSKSPIFFELIEIQLLI